jgi:hypothetical protein
MTPAELKTLTRQIDADRERKFRSVTVELTRMIRDHKAAETRPHDWRSLGFRRGFGIFNSSGELLQTVNTAVEACEITWRARR